MTDQATAATPVARGGTLALRLALAFVAVALAAVALLAGLTSAFSASDVRSLASQQRGDLTGAIAVAAAAVWDRENSWAGADLSPVLDLAVRTGTDVQIRDGAGRAVATSSGFAAQTGPQANAQVVVHGQQVGAVVARPPARGLMPPTAYWNQHCCGPSPGRPGWRRCWPCSPPWWWHGGSPARLPG